jgi:hypothetical protein
VFRFPIEQIVDSNFGTAYVDRRLGQVQIIQRVYLTLSLRTECMGSFCVIALNLYPHRNKKPEVKVFIRLSAWERLR